MTAPLTETPKRDTQSIRGWLKDHGLPDRQATDIARGGQWELFKDDYLLTEFLQAQVNQYQAHQEQVAKRQQSTDAEYTDLRKVAAFLHAAGYYDGGLSRTELVGSKANSDLTVAIADYQRARGLNAGSGELDDATRNDITQALSFIAGQNPTSPAPAAHPTTNSTTDPALAKPAATPTAPSTSAPAPAPRASGGGTVHVTASASSAPTAPPSFSLTGDASTGMQTAYGYASALADIPELKQILDDAVRLKQTPDVIQAAVLNSAWYKSKRSAAAQWEIAKRLQPKDAQSKVADLAAQLQTSATATGFTLDPTRAKAMAEFSLGLGLTQQEIDKTLLGEYHFDANSAQGGSASLLDRLKATAKAYLVPVSDVALGNWVETIVRKTDTEDSFNEYVRNQAKSMFPTLAGSIDAGHTTATLLDPYAQVAQHELNTPVDMTDAKWMGALMTTDPKTGVRTMPTLDAWQTKIRTDPKYGWDGTVGAVNQAADFAQKLAQEMGKA